jgi:hypothetical protein
MSQAAFLQALDTALHTAFEAAGLASAGLYTAPGAEVAVPASVYIDKDIETIGDLRQFKAGRVEVLYVNWSIAPAQGGKLEVEGETYINGKELSNDGSSSRWTVRRG